MSKLILFQGDSITDALRSRDNGVYNGNGYPTLVAGRLGYEQPGQYTFVNRGISGNRIVDLYARIKIDLINLKPDVLSILIGASKPFLLFFSRERDYGLPPRRRPQPAYIPQESEVPPQSEPEI